MTDLDWMRYSMCRNDKHDAHFEDPAYAISICTDCPVIAECAAYADRIKPTHGVWAGINVEQPVMPDADLFGGILLPQKSCRSCGVQFHPHHKLSEFCNRLCRQMYHTARWNETKRARKHAQRTEVSA